MGLRITATTYRGEPGFLISGRDNQDRKVSVFCKDKGSAEHIRAKIKAGEEISVADFKTKKESNDVPNVQR